MKTLNESPRIIRLFGCCELPAKQQLLLLMEKAAGRTVAALLDDKHRLLSDAQKVQIIYEAALGMKYLHSMGVMHRNLKSVNLLLDDKGRVKVSDFGISFRTLYTSRTTISIMNDASDGTTPWRAPELLDVADDVAEAAFTEAGDMYSFGIVMGEVMTRNTNPYPNMVPIQIAMAVTAGQRPNVPPEYFASLPQLRQLMISCLLQDPLDRPSFVEMAMQLQLLEQMAKQLQQIKAAGAKTDNVDLAFTLLWETADDLDIHVETPAGFEISWKSRQSPCGGKLDVDMNANSRDRFVVHKADNDKKRGFRNGEEIDDLTCAVENVYWAKGTAPSGRYRCSIQNGKYEKEEIGGTPKGRPIPFKLQIKIGNEFIDLTPGKTPGGLNFKFLKSPAGEGVLDPQTGRMIRTQQPEWTVKDQHSFTSDASFGDALVFEFEYKVQQDYKIVSNPPVDVWSFPWPVDRSLPFYHGFAMPAGIDDRKFTSYPVRLKQLQTGNVFKVVNRERKATRQFPPMKCSSNQIEKAFDYDQRVDKVYSLGDEVLVRDPPATRKWQKGTIRKIGKAATYKNKTGVDTVLMTKEGFVVRTHAPYHDNSDAKVSRL
jgi:serine/threonine protein kinase